MIVCNNWLIFNKLDFFKQNKHNFLYIHIWKYGIYIKILKALYIKTILYNLLYILLFYCLRRLNLLIFN